MSERTVVVNVHNSSKGDGIINVEAFEKELEQLGLRLVPQDILNELTSKARKYDAIMKFTKHQRFS